MSGAGEMSKTCVKPDELTSDNSIQTITKTTANLGMAVCLCHSGTVCTGHRKSLLDRLAASLCVIPERDTVSKNIRQRMIGQDT